MNTTTNKNRAAKKLAGYVYQILFFNCLEYDKKLFQECEEAVWQDILGFPTAQGQWLRVIEKSREIEKGELKNEFN